MTTQQTLFRDHGTITERLRENPGPAAVWASVGVLLIGLQAGALLEFAGVVAITVLETVNVVSPAGLSVSPAPAVAFKQAAAELPHLLARETITGHGYYSVAADEWVTGPVYFDGNQWVGTFLGLEPKHAWLVRVGLVYAYTAALLGWLWVGYRRWRRHYRAAEWTPRDDVVDRFRNHSWGLFGCLIVVLFLTMVVFGPAMAPTTNQINNVDPYSYEFKYYDEAAGEVTTATVGNANSVSFSDNTQTVGLWSYDEFGRFHPAGTMPDGQDLFTFLMHGAQLSLVVGLVTVVLSTVLATTAALLSAYYKGYVDLGMVLLSDAIFALPGLLLIIMLSVLLGGTWIASVYDGGVLLALIFAATGWPGLWRSIRGPALQTAEQPWIDAARSFGQTPRVTMRKHILPYLAGYLLVYGSMSLGGVIIGIAGLSYLGLGVNPPAPEWGRAVDMGQSYISSSSWHISIVPGTAVTLLVIGFNALGDGIRDAIDPESEAEAANTAGADRGGGA
ncbi:MAG: ABC-type dipeptide/oligopeptide/nickel transport system, permease component [Halorubrum sp. J07HR59]|nr:MAG: ABC-type dipeptide/oligopeptide/nickel transport system, permease component [Halorubrum sp. J07HR59]